MTNKETTAIALKCFAIYILSRVLITLPTLGALKYQLSVMEEGGMSSTTWIIIIAVVTFIFGAIAAFLVWKSSCSVMNKETTPDNSDNMGANGVMRIILACMGVYFVIDALMILPAAIAGYTFSRSVPNSNSQALMFLITQLIELTFGALLIAKPGKWVKAIRSIGEI